MNLNLKTSTFHIFYHYISACYVSNSDQNVVHIKECYVLLCIHLFIRVIFISMYRGYSYSVCFSAYFFLISPVNFSVAFTYSLILLLFSNYFPSLILLSLLLLAGASTTKILNL